MSLLAALRRYAAHGNPITAAGNTVALVVGGNGPFYPLYLWFIEPEAATPALLTMLASPFFLAIPWLSRRSTFAAALALPLVGMANTVFTTALLGAQTGASLFLLPCLILAALLWQHRLALLGMLGLGLLVQQALLRWPWPPLAGLTETQQASLQLLNASSVGTLLAFLALVLSGLAQSSAGAMPAKGVARS